MHPQSRRRRRRVLTLLIPVVAVFPSTTDAADGDIDRALETLGLTSMPAQVQVRVEAVLGNQLDDAVSDDQSAAVRLEESLRRWDLAAPDWRALPLSLMEQVRVCRDARLHDPGSVGDECGDRLLIELRLRQMEQARSRFDERLSAAGDDEVALGDLDRLQDRVMDHLREVEAADTLERNAALGNAGFLDGSYQLLRDRLMEQRSDMDRRMEQAGMSSMGEQS